jgi:class 3 adenylate cyclase/tetratricopeptide (TPR) repeat protein
MRCVACGTENREDRRFCAQCGATLELTCPSCGTANEPGERFCGECGNPLFGAAPGPAPAAQAPRPAVSERRLVSVLFVDLVGFTTLSEHRDPEEIRELLSRYFDRCRAVIEELGGTVEKFIGDAVMAVWGTPVAHEDDAERAVRAAIALTQAVNALAEEVRMPDLRVRGGVLTGSAAVEVGTDGEGMVLGDTVNTASRLQSLAAPGEVLVDDVTRRASEAAIAYEDTGEHEVKGREQPVRAWRALQVVAGRGGAGRHVGLEAPFTGRERELAHIVTEWEAAASDSQARLVSIVGEAGLGKSRLLWEFSKHLDGLQRTVLWHQGRCLSYGEGVAYWALADMVRSRVGVVEEEDPDRARSKLESAVREHVPDERERRLVEPRLAHLLGLEDRTAPDRADLFSGWRLFFERLALQDPVVLVFEDVQWADSGLLEFIEYLLEWSSDFPIFILALGRPELGERRSEWPSLALEPLPSEAMAEVLGGLAPGLPDELVDRIIARAEGVPLYAVETVRMLLDRGLLAQEGPRYVVTGEVTELAIPETLQALLSARLDGLEPDERALVQDAAVLGQSFSAAGLAALGGRSIGEAERMLETLVAKQVFAFDDSELSAERGHYGFLQALLRTIAYGTLTRRDRKARHLAAAGYIEAAWGSEAAEIAEVLAAHYLAAAEADPDADDAPRIRDAARETLADAGRRAASLALGEEAQRIFDKAAELAEDDSTRAELLEQAGRAAALAGEWNAARDRLDAAVSLFDAGSQVSAAARARAAVAEVLAMCDRLDDALAMAQRAYVDLEPGLERAAVAAQLAKFHMLRTDLQPAIDATDEALAIAEPARDWRTIADALITRGTVLVWLGRSEEGNALMSRALELALSHDLQLIAIRAHNNLGSTAWGTDRPADAFAHSEAALEITQARGDRGWERQLLTGRVSSLVALGRWDEATVIIQSLGMEKADPDDIVALSDAFLGAARLYAARGDFDALRQMLPAVELGIDSTDTQVRLSSRTAKAVAVEALGRSDEAFELARTAIEAEEPASRRDAYGVACAAAWAMRDDAELESLVDHVDALPPGAALPSMRAHADRFAGLLAAHRGDLAAATERLRKAADAFREVGYPFDLAQVLLERGELLAAAGRSDEAEPLLAAAEATLADLRAEPWLERVARARAGATEPSSIAPA